jgi:hypothetical protein
VLVLLLLALLVLVVLVVLVLVPLVLLLLLLLLVLSLPLLSLLLELLLLLVVLLPLALLVLVVVVVVVLVLLPLVLLLLLLLPSVLLVLLPPLLHCRLSRLPNGQLAPPQVQLGSPLRFLHHSPTAPRADLTLRRSDSLGSGSGVPSFTCISPSSADQARGGCCLDEARLLKVPSNCRIPCTLVDCRSPR